MDDTQLLLALGAFVALLTLAMETLAKRAVFPQWLCRKVLHVGAVGCCALAPLLLGSLLELTLLVVAAELLLLWGVGTGRLFPGPHGSRSWGIALFPLPYLLLLICFPGVDSRWLIALPMLILAISDGLAAFVGQPFPFLPYRLTADEKTVGGSLAFTLSAWALVAFFPSPLQTLISGWLHATALLVALLLAVLEGLGSHGRDNLYVPLGAVVLLAHFAAPESQTALLPTWLAVAASVPFVLWTTRQGWLTLGGAVSASLIGILVLIFQGAIWLLPLGLFFLSSSLLGRALSSRSERSDAKHGRARDATQVFSNGGPYLLAAVLLPPEQAHWAMLVSMAVATADTWASEIGVARAGRTFDILRGGAVPAGLSGGISMQGTLGGLGGAVLIGMAAAVLYKDAALPAAGIVVLWGMAGMFADSLLGAALQARYRTTSGGLSDQSLPGTLLISGHAWMSNDRVNLFSNGLITALAVLF